MKGKRPGGWIALAWRNRSDPAWEGVSDAARLLWIDGLLWSGEHGMDGRVPRDVTRLVNRARRASCQRLRDELLASGWWVTYPDGGIGVPFDAWNRWQDTAEQRREARARDAERKAKWRQARRGTPAGRDATVGEGVGVGRSPLPLHPPSRSEFEVFTGEDGLLYVRPDHDGQDPRHEH